VTTSYTTTFGTHTPSLLPAECFLWISQQTAIISLYLAGFYSQKTMRLVRGTFRHFSSISNEPHSICLSYLTSSPYLYFVRMNMCVCVQVCMCTIYIYIIYNLYNIYSSSSTGTTARCGLWPVEQDLSIFSICHQLSPPSLNPSSFSFVRLS
jgi:hypothetical protein